MIEKPSSCENKLAKLRKKQPINCNVSGKHFIFHPFIFARQVQASPKLDPNQDLY
jgi:hypothetical protein